MGTHTSRPARWVFSARQALSDRRHRVRRPGALLRPLPRDAGDESAPLVCRAVFEEICILANGDVVCSCADSAGLRVYGNVRQQPLAEILAGEMYREIREWQLEARPDRWCPVIDGDCPLRVSRATPLDSVDGHPTRMLQLEPTSHCNLACPSCPVTDFATDPRYTADRVGKLSLTEMIAIFEQLPSLEKALLYNYGETFVHPETVPLLRWLRRNRPGLAIHVSTNGLALTESKVGAIVADCLLDRMLFAIDGAYPESYARYRVGGKFERAMGALRGMVAAAEAHGVRDRFEIWWQYILFEWNDSDEEIAEARRLAAEIGVPIEWVVTHTPGASQRFLPGSAALADLVGGERAFRALSCDLKGAEIAQAIGAEADRHRAKVEPVRTRVRGAAGDRMVLPVVVRNSGRTTWDGPNGVRLGLRLLDGTGRAIDELRGVELPTGLAPGVTLTLFPEVELPASEGTFHLFIDLVEEGVCWFSERGSSPSMAALEVNGAADEGLRAERLAREALPVLREKLSEGAARLAEAGLGSGGALEDQLLANRRGGTLPLGAELELRRRLSELLA